MHQFVRVSLLNEIGIFVKEFIITPNTICPEKQLNIEAY